MGSFLLKFVSARIEEKYYSIMPYLPKKGTIIDIGSGNCLLASRLTAGGFKVTPVDISNNSFIPSLTPIIYNGTKLPFNDKSFETALLVTVLHHIPQPELVLKEASRVAKKVIIIEEIYNNLLTKYITFIIDSVFNLEFFGHPHSNKTDKGWRETFASLGLKPQVAEYSLSLGLLQRVLYVLISGPSN